MISEIDKSPSHVGIIMDGNGRWAGVRGLPRSAGHTAGAKNFKIIAKHCAKIGIKHLSVYAFSTENFKRSLSEVKHLVYLFGRYLDEALADFSNENTKIVFLGDVSIFPDNVRKLIEKVRDLSSQNTGMTLNIAVNYGGRADIVSAAKKIASSCMRGEMEVGYISEASFSQNLDTCGQPDVDLLIRTGGEHRLSNFLLWQSAYAEIVIMDVFWPDFDIKCLDEALKVYAGRNRRFGGV